MACLYPVHAWRSREINPETGKYGITFNPIKALNSTNSMALTCGRCIGCRIDRSGDWAVRNMHEAQLWSQSCFLTLTYDDKNLPTDFSVHVEPLQLFFKKLRHRVPQKIRYFACGEYGEDDPDPLEGNRPHFHALVYNYRPSDLKLHSRNLDNPLYTSEKLATLWPYGFSTVGNVTYQSAAYVARYTQKKISGDPAPEHYTRVHPVSGNICHVRPEFMVCSRRPGIGDGWFETYKSDIYPADFVVVNGKQHRVPKYYHRKLTEEEQKKSNNRRAVHARKHKDDNTPARLAVRETVLKAKVGQLKRSLKRTKS